MQRYNMIMIKPQHWNITGDLSSYIGELQLKLIWLKYSCQVEGFASTLRCFDCNAWTMTIFY